MLPPVVVLLKLMAVVEDPLHTVLLVTVFNVAVGLTVMVNVVAAPVQVVPALV